MPLKLALFTSDSWGIYCPQRTIESLTVEALVVVTKRIGLSNVAAIRGGPDSEWYWEAWETFLNADYTFAEGKARFDQDGDVWLVPDGWIRCDIHGYVEGDPCPECETEEEASDAT